MSSHPGPERLCAMPHMHFYMILYRPSADSTFLRRLRPHQVLCEHAVMVRVVFLFPSNYPNVFQSPSLPRRFAHSPNRYPTRPPYPTCCTILVVAFDGKPSTGKFIIFNALTSWVFFCFILSLRLGFTVGSSSCFKKNSKATAVATPGHIDDCIIASAERQIYPSLSVGEPTKIIFSAT